MAAMIEVVILFIKYFTILRFIKLVLKRTKKFFNIYKTLSQNEHKTYLPKLKNVDFWKLIWYNKNKYCGGCLCPLF